MSTCCMLTDFDPYVNKNSEISHMCDLGLITKTEKNQSSLHFGYFREELDRPPGFVMKI